MWDLSGPGIKPVSPALTGRFLTTGPSGKPWSWILWFGDICVLKVSVIFCSESVQLRAVYAGL